METIKLLIILAIIFGIWYLIHRLFKIPKVNCLGLVTGAVKSGKSTLSIYLTYRQWKRSHRRWKIRGWIRKLFKKENDREEPLIYSNIPLNIDYVPITEELLTRTKRFNYGSIIYIGEASLVSNSMNYKDKIQNEEQLLFYKLIGHETKGGGVIIDTQCIQDCHYAIKRSVSNYFHIHHTISIPFFLIMYIKEMIYSEDGNIINTNTGDAEEGLKRVIVPKWTWKKFDAYCYSIMTDGLPIENKKEKGKKDNLKADKIVSFNEYKTLYRSKKK